MFNCLSPLSRTHFTQLETDVSFSSPQLHAWSRVPLNNYLLTVKKVHCSDTVIPGNRYPGTDNLEFLLGHVSSHLGLPSNQGKRSKEVNSIARKKIERRWRGRV